MIHNLKILQDNDISSFFDQLIDVNGVTTLGFLNQHAFNLMCSDRSILDYFLTLDYLLRDGKGIELGCRYRGVDPGVNLNGTDFIPLMVRRVIDLGKRHKFFAYGTQSPWLESGASNLFQGESSFFLNGFCDTGSYVSHFQANACQDSLNIVVLAMGMPKQEKIAFALKESSSFPSLIICGGAIIDFQAGRFNRAPEFMQRNGLEWLYRLCKEPRRLFKRYILGIPIFFYNVLKYTK